MSSVGVLELDRGSAGSWPVHLGMLLLLMLVFESQPRSAAFERQPAAEHAAAAVEDRATSSVADHENEHASPLRGDAATEAERLSRLAREEVTRGRLRRAAALFRRSIALAGGGTSRARLLLYLAYVEGNLGEYRKSLEAAREALRLYETARDDPGVASALFRLGVAHDEQGDYGDAQRHYFRSLDLYRRLGDRAGEAEVLSALGTSYQFMGDSRAALRFFEQYRELLIALGQPSRLCFALEKTGTVLEDLGRGKEAGQRFHEALRLLPDEGQEWIRADLLFRLGRLARREGRTEPALVQLERALIAAVRSENRWAEARTRIEIALIEADRGSLSKALLFAEMGAGMFRRMGAPDQEWEGLYVYGGLLERAGRPDAATKEYLEAMDILESVRSTIGVPVLRSRYTPRVRKVYEAAMSALFRSRSRGDGDEQVAARMFEICERYRARSFAEILAESRVELASNDSPLREKERGLRARIAALRARLTSLAGETRDREELEHELFAAERSHDALLLELREADPAYAALVVHPEIDRNLVRSLLGADVDLVAYHLGKDASFGWVFDGSRLEVFELPPRSEIENLVLFFRALIFHRNDPSSLKQIARKLHGILLGPMTPSLHHGRPLMVVPDGALFLLPFEALLVSDSASDSTGLPPGGPRPEGPASADRYLIEERPISYVASISVLAALREREKMRSWPQSAAKRKHGRPGDRVDAGRMLLAYGDPVPPHGSSKRRLPYTASEVRRISGLFPVSRRTVRVGQEATESNLRRDLELGARVVHLATHGLIDGEHPERSGLALSAEPGGASDPSRSASADGFLSMTDIFGLPLPAELVVLSACETAQGELLQGEGVLGLTRAFLSAGAPTLVASLWPVEDRSAERLMVSFYEGLGQGRSVDEALRQAKIESIGDKAASSDPFHWAGFVVVGDGRRAIALDTVKRRGPLSFFTAVAFFIFFLAAALYWWLSRRYGPGDQLAKGK